MTQPQWVLDHRPNLEWMDEARCVTWPDQGAFIEVVHWSSQDQTTRALTALMACRACPVKAECVEFVAPVRSHFDGIAGGKSWRDGKHNPPPKPTNERQVAADLLYRHGQKVIKIERRQK